MPRFVVALKVRSDDPAGNPFEAEIDTAAALLKQLHGQVATTADGWQMIFIVDSANPLAASKRAHLSAMTVAKQAGLPAGEVVALEAVRKDVREERRARPRGCPCSDQRGWTYTR
jgi:hypothetical protein